MATPQTSTSQSTKSRQNHQHHKNRKQPNSLNPSKNQSCDQSRYAAVDVVFLIIVMGASGFLVFPYVELFCHGVSRIGGAILSVVKDKTCQAPMVYACLGLSIFLIAWGISKCTGKKCGNPNCRGFRNSTEFDLQLETDKSAQNLSTSVREDGPEQDLFDFLPVHQKELRDKLREIAPENGRAVVVFRARCGCPIGRIEVPGPKKLQKIKK